MNKTIAAASVVALLASAGAALAQTTVRVAWCARTVSSAAAPFAIATKLGWYAEARIKVELVPLPGSTDCVKLVATKDVQVSRPSVEPLAIIRPQGVKAKFFYTAYQGNIYGIAVCGSFEPGRGRHQSGAVRPAFDRAVGHHPAAGR